MYYRFRATNVNELLIENYISSNDIVKGKFIKTYKKIIYSFINS